MEQRECTKCRAKRDDIFPPTPGVYWRHNGYPDVCYPCNGTGFIKIYTKEEKEQMTRYQDAFNEALSAIKDHALTIGDDARYLAIEGFWRLKRQEPGRLPRLYASLNNGRVDDVVRALIQYEQAA